jgi:hypothetical protein
MGLVFGPMVAMAGPETLREKDLDRLTQQFLPFVTEELFGLTIHQNYVAIFSHDDHRVRSGIE